ncbi:MAG: pilus assembly protein [Elusimicrobia bacterium]|nr:pilus assembly protein [Elusimicrobiota bacterium]
MKRSGGQGAGRPPLAPSWRVTNSPGQVVVEVLLILPIFMLIIFAIMEIGHLAFRTILIHHAAYEVARIGSLTAKPDIASPGCRPPSLNAERMRRVGRKIFPVDARVDVRGPIATLEDPQEGCLNYDVEVTIAQRVPLVFPMTGLILGKPIGSRFRPIAGTVRMPIERPLFK